MSVPAPDYGLSTVRLHGNGFVQVDLAPNLRLDVWDRALEGLGQKVPTPVHDHRFDFRSTVLLGRLRHTVYTVGRAQALAPDQPLPPGASELVNHRLWVARPRQGEDTYLEPTEVLVSLAEEAVFEFDAGETYTFRAGDFHRSDPVTPTVVTLLAKTKTYLGTSFAGSVAVPLGVEPDNEFIRYPPDPGFLRDVVLRAIQQLLGPR